MKKIILSATLIVALFSCKKDINKPSPYHIGDTLNGGLITYIDQSGYHGMISTGEDISGGIPFSDNSLGITITSTAYGTGSSNTLSIVDKQGINQFYAADWGVGLGWSLPSKDELGLIYRTKFNIHNPWTSIYWSSSIDSDNKVWVEDFSTGKQYTLPQDSIAAVRGIKYF